MVFSHRVETAETEVPGEFGQGGRVAGLFLLPADGFENLLLTALEASFPFDCRFKRQLLSAPGTGLIDCRATGRCPPSLTPVTRSTA